MVIITRIWKIARIVNVMFIRKFKKPISCFQIEVYSLLFFSVFLPSSLVSFALLIIIRRKKKQRTHVNKAANISKIKTMKSTCPDNKHQIINAILNFPKII